MTVGFKSNGPQRPHLSPLFLPHPHLAHLPAPRPLSAWWPRQPVPFLAFVPARSKPPPPLSRAGELANGRPQNPASSARVRTSLAPTSALVSPLLPLFSRGCARNRRNRRARTHDASPPRTSPAPIKESLGSVTFHGSQRPHSRPLTRRVLAAIWDLIAAGRKSTTAYSAATIIAVFTTSPP